MKMKGADLVRLVQERTTNWHPNLRKLFELADLATCFPLNIRTSVPVPAWQPTNVTLIGRHGQPEDVVEAILFLAGGRSGWITGTTLPVDGGVLAGRSPAAA
jgi:NAD(P)-dependent dehydrogenase (short-subunit alcohol dehydrogenase family)